ncbi:hypothetical protein DCMF_26245 [Candidatus Formimonas warabiya]|uniref:Uncharacterized protein n=1 Tax=Formimonas warabiya TaxID=1761012 RepID=A0A3G1KZF8_FORW1|nr:hypothetical protein DCMF_26245 [Candidatus Formimonas warabiya]
MQASSLILYRQMIKFKFNKLKSKVDPMTPWGFFYNATVEKISFVEIFSYLCAFQRSGGYAHRLFANRNPHLR